MEVVDSHRHRPAHPAKLRLFLAATAENSMEMPQKLKIELSYDPAIPLLGIYLKKSKTLIQKDICTHMFSAALFTIAKIWKQRKCPSIDEWIQKRHINTMGYYSAIKKNEILPFVTTWIDLEGIMLSEISQKKTNTISCHVCGI